MFLHESFCIKHVKCCEICQEPINIDELQDHIDEKHKNIGCNDCGKDLEKARFSSHKKKCDFMPKNCSFCELELPLVDLHDHEYICGSKTEKCELCFDYIPLREKDLHLEYKCRAVITPDVKIFKEKDKDNKNKAEVIRNLGTEEGFIEAVDSEFKRFEKDNFDFIAMKRGKRRDEGSKQNVSSNKVNHFKETAVELRKRINRNNNDIDKYFGEIKNSDRNISSKSSILRADKYSKMKNENDLNSKSISNANANANANANDFIETPHKNIKKKKMNKIPEKTEYLSNNLNNFDNNDDLDLEFEYDDELKRIIEISKREQ